MKIYIRKRSRRAGKIETIQSSESLAELTSQPESLFIESLELLRIFGHSVHFHRPQRTYADDTALVLHTLHHGKLLIVDGYASAQGYAQARILPVYERRNLTVAPGVAVATVACADNDIGRMALPDGPHHGYTVHDTSVEHRRTVYVYRLTDVWQTAAGMYDIDGTAAV